MTHAETLAVAIMVIGALFAVIGLFMLLRGRKEGRNAIKALGIEVEFSSSAVFVFLAGVGLIVAPPVYLVRPDSAQLLPTTHAVQPPPSTPAAMSPATTPVEGEADNSGPFACAPDYVWRKANPLDLVCVTRESRDRVAEENRLAPERRVKDGGAYGPNTCQAGYVWRQAFDGDLVCVAPEVRDLVFEENDRAASRLARP